MTVARDRRPEGCSERDDAGQPCLGTSGRSQESNGDEQDVILMGDFNMPPDEGYWKPLRAEKPMAGLSQTSRVTNVIPESGKTTLTTKGYGSSYDIWFDQTFTANEFTGRAGVTRFVESHGSRRPPRWPWAIEVAPFGGDSNERRRRAPRGLKGRTSKAQDTRRGRRLRLVRHFNAPFGLGGTIPSSGSLGSTASRRVWASSGAGASDRLW